MAKISTSNYYCYSSDNVVFVAVAVVVVEVVSRLTAS